MTDAPEIMFDEDGTPIAVRADVATSRRAAFRYVAEEFDWWMDDFDCVQIGDDEYNLKYRPRLSTYRIWINDIKLKAMRPWREGDDDWGEFGRDAWFWCAPAEPYAINYWELNA